MNTITDAGILTYRNSTLNPPANKSADDKKLKQACLDFSAIFVKQMLDSMRKTVEKSGLTGGGSAEEIFEDMLYDEYAKKIVSNANFGIADLMFSQLSESNA